ncbi:TetR/AcrR family transcriptional regulator [Aestuariicella hydrocarbonica]|uniref:TetR/AcrR family transcriptional regulator n=1 Tax=Pseudomaricurvus hydrocarbonicus TaxID=1470433 RepID=A0A9E5JW16_9GAMM|nr:TetR/AcrR family transcriptional regulator [Aestuariicella hydrocarbonica]NHO66628.1 TetR/AcrR family transcriptional regulator [Aestuariicella hydrocarbonica]
MDVLPVTGFNSGCRPEHLICYRPSLSAQYDTIPFRIVCDKLVPDKQKAPDQLVGVVLHKQHHRDNTVLMPRSPRQPSLNKKQKSPVQFSRERLEVLMDAAKAIFLEKGLTGASIDQISVSSRVSKSTIYRHFRSKELLFEAVALKIAEQQAQAIATFELDIENPADTLRQFAHHIYRVDSRPEFLETLRINISEAGRYPAMSKSIWGQARLEVLKDLIAFFDQLIARGKMQHPDSGLAANTFYMLARGNLRPLLSVSSNPDDELKKVDIDINIFLKGCEIT